MVRILCTLNKVRQSSIGYLPVIPASPTESSTVLEILQHDTAIADKLDQEDITIVCDQASYAKALDNVWLPAMSNLYLIYIIYICS